jgi:hypothetical protein
VTGATREGTGRPQDVLPPATTTNLPRAKPAPTWRLHARTEFARIPRRVDAFIFSVDAWGDPVGSGATAPRCCTLGGVAKQNSEALPHVVANEFICGRLGLMLGLPVPPGTIVATDAGEPAYVSLRFGKQGERPPPAVLADVWDEEPGAGSKQALMEPAGFEPATSDLQSQRSPN